MVRVVFLMILGCLSAFSVMAQQERKFIREGNDFFHQQDFEKAEVEYRKAVDQKMDSFEATFNLADALYKQKKYEEAFKKFSELAQRETNKERLGEIYHNMGNTLLSLEKVDESIEAYKESLRNRPSATETKYNLEFARQKKQQNQQNQDQQNQNQQDQNKDQDKQEQNKDQQNKDQDKQDQNKDQQDKNQDKQDQNKDQQDKNQDKQDQNKDQQNQNQNQQQQKPQEGKISKEDAERLLEALQNDEKNVQEKVQKQKAQEQKAKRMKIDKNW